MDSLRRFLFLLTLLTVKSLEISEAEEMEAGTRFAYQMQQEVVLPPEVIEEIRQRALSTHTTERMKGPKRVIDTTKNPSIPFPLARPTRNNIIAICHYSNLRPRYTEDMLPRNGFGHLHRQANAVNQLESWFTVCCSNGTQDEDLVRCCAQQAWERSLFAFCSMEFSIKTSHYHCCKRRNQEILDCFEEDAPDPSYQPSGHVVPTMLSTSIEGFVFNLSSCEKTSVSAINSRPEVVIEPPTPRWSALKQRITMLDEEEAILGHAEGPRTLPLPLARPTSTNIQVICQYSNRYMPEQRPLVHVDILTGKSIFHETVFDQLRFWYHMCCANGPDDELTLCCAQQAWEKIFSVLCEEENKFKTSHCCRKNGQRKWDCFEKKSADIYFQVSVYEELVALSATIRKFDVEASTCKKINFSEGASTVLAESQSSAISLHVDFPPGRPNLNNIVPICAHHKNRPRYLTSCLPQTGLNWFAHQLKAINSLEKSFGKCCRKTKDIKDCTDRKWKKMVNRFCKDDKKVERNQFECCKKQREEEQYDCFSTAAPNPDYKLMNDGIHLEAPPSFNMLCDVYKAPRKMNNMPFNVDEVAEKCCSLVEDERTACLKVQLDNLLDDVCEADNPSLAKVQSKCCKKSAKGRSNCITKLFLHYISKAKKISNRQKCPSIF